MEASDVNEEAEEATVTSLKKLSQVLLRAGHSLSKAVPALLSYHVKANGLVQSLSQRFEEKRLLAAMEPFLVDAPSAGDLDHESLTSLCTLLTSSQLEVKAGWS